MLITCPECELKVSDVAISCPHCGYPMKPEKIKSSFRSKRRRRLPNGFGQISEIKGRFLRKPFRAMVTVGVLPNGRPKTTILKPDGYFATYNEAYEALMEYNKHPYDLKPSMTMQELYDKWIDSRKDSLNLKTLKSYDNQWDYCRSLRNMRVTDVRHIHLKYCIEEGTSVVFGEEKHPNARMKSRIKAMFNMMFDYAVEFEVVPINISRNFSLDKSVTEEIETNRKAHISFTEDEMKVLWENINTVPYVNFVVADCYLGLRPQELCKIELKNVHLDEDYMIGGMKTIAGTNRRIPIHPAIKNIIVSCYEDAVAHNSKYLFNCFDPQPPETYSVMTYNRYAQRFRKIVDKLNLNPEHSPHDTRKQFITMAKEAGVDEYALKYIVGHKIYDLTESVYTTRDPKWLNREVEKIDASRFVV